MKNRMIGATLAVALLAPQLHAADIGVSVSIGQPGFYGQIDIGDYPRPQVVYAQPVIIQRSPVAYAPVYLRVPPGHEKHWYKHCHEYGACGRPVYFVRDNWYTDVYAPQYHSRHGGGHEHDDHDRGHRGDDHGKGHGKGKGKGRD